MIGRFDLSSIQILPPLSHLLTIIRSAETWLPDAWTGAWTLLCSIRDALAGLLFAAALFIAVDKTQLQGLLSVRSDETIGQPEISQRKADRVA